jgi:hypothetical protein
MEGDSKNKLYMKITNRRERPIKSRGMLFDVFVLKKWLTLSFQFVYICKTIDVPKHKLVKLEYEY